MLAEIGLVVGAIVTLLVLKYAITTVIRRRQRKKALSGDYGDEAQWAAEIVDSGDEAFTIAVATMDESELRDIGIIAESKEELREQTVERFDELSNESLPEEFQ